MTRRVRSVADEDGFTALAPLWADLAAQAGQDAPFLSHDWFACCRAALPPGHVPEVLVVEERGEPVGLIPLVRWRERVRGLAVRCVGFLDCPDAPQVDVLAPGDPSAVVAALLDHLAQRPDWDVARLHKLPAGSPTLKAFESALPGRFPWRRAGEVSSPYLAIAGPWAAFYGAKTQRFKKTARNIQNRLERAGRVVIEEHVSVDPAAPLFADLVDLTRRSWKAEHGVAIATMPRMDDFFARLTARASANGWLSLWLLRLDGRPIAMEYQLQWAGKAHALRADYDLAYRELSPGSALNFAIARSLFERATIREYDMGPGLNDYKMRWATGTHETVQLELYSPRLSPRLLHALDTVVISAARRLRGAIRSIVGR